MWAVVFLIEFITCLVKVYLPEKESMWGFQEIMRMPPATPCFDVIINRFMVKCLNLIFHFNLSAFQHDVAVFLFFFSLLSQFGVVGMDLVNCLPLSLPSYKREIPGP